MVNQASGAAVNAAQTAATGVRPGKELAILGGEREVTSSPPERWTPPVEREIQLVTGLIRDRYLSAAGRGFSREFEDEFGSWLGVKHCASQNNGTSTLQAAY